MALREQVGSRRGARRSATAEPAAPLRPSGDVAARVSVALRGRSGARRAADTLRVRLRRGVTSRATPSMPCLTTVGACVALAAHCPCRPFFIGAWTGQCGRLEVSGGRVRGLAATADTPSRPAAASRHGGRVGAPACGGPVSTPPAPTGLLALARHGAMRSSRVVGSRVRDSAATVDTPLPIGSLLRGGGACGRRRGRAAPARARARPMVAGRSGAPPSDGGRRRVRGCVWLRRERGACAPYLPFVSCRPIPYSHRKPVPLQGSFLSA